MEHKVMLIHVALITICVASSKVTVKMTVTVSTTWFAGQIIVVQTFREVQIAVESHLHAMEQTNEHNLVAQIRTVAMWMKDTVQTIMIAMEIFYVDQIIVTPVVFRKGQIAVTSNQQVPLLPRSMPASLKASSMVCWNRARNASMSSPCFIRSMNELAIDLISASPSSGANCLDEPRSKTPSPGTRTKPFPTLKSMSRPLRSVP